MRLGKRSSNVNSSLWCQRFMIMAKGAGQLVTNHVAVFPILRKTKCTDESQTFCTSKKTKFFTWFFPLDIRFLGFTANYVLSIQGGIQRHWRMGLSVESNYNGRVAQLVEQVTFNHWVTGSNPVALTIAWNRFDGTKRPRPHQRPGALCMAGFKGEKAIPLHNLRICPRRQQHHWYRGNRQNVHGRAYFLWYFAVMLLAARQERRIALYARQRLVCWKNWQ